MTVGYWISIVYLLIYCVNFSILRPDRWTFSCWWYTWHNTMAFWGFRWVLHSFCISNTVHQLHSLGFVLHRLAKNTSPLENVMFCQDSSAWSHHEDLYVLQCRGWVNNWFCHLYTPKPRDPISPVLGMPLVSSCMVQDLHASQPSVCAFKLLGLFVGGWMA